MLDLLVVGAGFFGRMIALHARASGMRVELVGKRREGSASEVAGCVVKPSWMSSMTKQQIDAALSDLDQWFGLRQVDFTLPLVSKRVTAFRVEPSAILRAGEAIEENITRLEGHETNVYAWGNTAFANEHAYAARRVVVATGQWSGELCPWAPSKGRWGWSHRTPPVPEARIVPWAPYRQSVALNLDDGRGWVGDGQALKESSATPERLSRSLERCASTAQCEILKMVTSSGARPYAETGGEPCLVSQQGRVIAVTGGAKNGTAAAAWAAREVVGRLS